MAKAAITLLVLVALLVGGDFALRAVAESRVAGLAQDRLGLPDEPDVDLEGFPFVLHALRRRFPQAEVRVEAIQAGGLAVERLELVLEDVRVGSWAVLAGGEGNVSAGSGRGTALVTEGSLTRYLEGRGVPLRVELARPDVRVSGTVSIGPFEADATAVGRLAVADGTLEFRPQRVEVEDGIEVPVEALAFRIELPEALPGLVYRAVDVESGRVALRFRLAGPALRL